MNILGHCKDKSNQGISVWQVSKRRPLFLCGNLKTIPNLDANQCYIILSFKRLSILNDKAASILKLFYWVGSKSDCYDKCFQVVDSVVQELSSLANAKIRLYIEYQNQESFRFLSLFKQHDILEQTQEVSVVQYQDYVKIKNQQQFPKLFVFDMLDFQFEYKRIFIRVYERKIIEPPI